MPKTYRQIVIFYFYFFMDYQPLLGFFLKPLIILGFKNFFVGSGYFNNIFCEETYLFSSKYKSYYLIQILWDGLRRFLNLFVQKLIQRNRLEFKFGSPVSHSVLLSFTPPTHSNTSTNIIVCYQERHMRASKIYKGK